MRSEIHIAPDSPALALASSGAETVQAPGGPDRVANAEPSREPFGRFRRARGDAHPAPRDNAAQDEVALQLQVMLLSEENARLKSERHRPSDIGTLIEQMRELGERAPTWTLHGELGRVATLRRLWAGG